MSTESTVHATPVEVRYVKSPFLYESVRIGGNAAVVGATTASQGALREEKRKRKGLLNRLFGD